MPKCRRFIACYNIILYCIYGISAIAAASLVRLFYIPALRFSFTCVSRSLYSRWRANRVQQKRNNKNNNNNNETNTHNTREKNSISTLLLDFELKHTKENGLRGIWTTHRPHIKCSIRSDHDYHRMHNERDRIQLRHTSMRMVNVRMLSITLWMCGTETRCILYFMRRANIFKLYF